VGGARRLPSWSRRDRDARHREAAREAHRGTARATRPRRDVSPASGEALSSPEVERPDGEEQSNGG
jgi:hypothetical protein